MASMTNEQRDTVYGMIALAKTRATTVVYYGDPNSGCVLLTEYPSEGGQVDWKIDVDGYAFVW